VSVTSEIRLDVPPGLVERARDGDRAALEDLILRSYRPAYTLALRLMGNPDDAAEATQEAFVRMVRALPKFREPGAYPTWIFKIVNNVCLTEMRRRSRREVPMELEVVRDPDPVDVEELATSRAFRVELDRAIAALPDTYRTVVVLRDVYGLSGEEAAAELGISPGALKVRLHRARRKLRDVLVAAFPEWGTGADGEKETA
jgi:RNA polymerase sigma-70 factor (ECF subfamily)